VQRTQVPLNVVVVFTINIKNQLHPLCYLTPSDYKRLRRSFTQMLVILITTPYLTVGMGVRVYFIKLINDKCQNDFSARQCLDLNVNLAKATIQMVTTFYSHPVVEIIPEYFI
jgi:hypothetical protein